MADDSSSGSKGGLGNQELSAQPKAPTLLQKSLQPMAGRVRPDPSGVGASTQPKAPLTTQQAKPPPSSDD